jgi:hypothetical protein
MPARKKAAGLPPNADLLAIDQQVETWSNAGQSMVYITRIGEYGRRESELIYGGKVFAISPQERRINQSMCHDPVNDPFTNGTFKPIALLEDEPDSVALRANPNVLDDDRIDELFALSGDDFKQRVVEITNVNAVDRLIDLAGDPHSGATVAQLEVLRRYRKLLAGETDEPEPVANPQPKAVTPR